MSNKTQEELDREEAAALSQMIEETEDLPPEDGEVMRAILCAVRDSGEAAKAHLRAGRSIVYSERDTPRGCLIRKYPDGRRELFRVVDGEEVTIRELD
ncbi:hypothetical protein [Fodinicurvata fenggangensis]|uniref:hypothetical protein n=1 Tax=Fodinicurvata fenggangensis TaxID=1121830 RepID=UPI00068CEB44|nr:hypothetical protein [Fodinicurvata fenggangensis]